MQQPELLEAIWPCNTMDYSFDGVELYDLDMDNDVGSLDIFSSILSTPTISSEISSSNQCFSSGLSDFSCGYLGFGQNLPNLAESSFTSNENEFLEEAICFSDLMELENPPALLETLSNNKCLTEIPSDQLSQIFCQENIEPHNKLSTCNLIKAFGDAMENGEVDLVEAILARFKEKADPTGETCQRLMYFLVQSLGTNMDYLQQESFKLYKVAFLAFYQIFPYGRFAHFFANSEIVRAVLLDSADIIVVDFDIGEGLQWPSLIESLGRRKQKCRMRLIAIKWEENNCNSSLSPRKFEETKSGLIECAKCFKVELELEEIGMEELAQKMKIMKKRGGGHEFIVFNCMVNLPHMGRNRSSRHVFEFLEMAKSSINRGRNTNRGIITFGDGLMEDIKRDFDGFGSFLEEKMVHFHALLESMDYQIAPQLIEARIAMEYLFVVPYFSSFVCLNKWELNIFGGYDNLRNGLEPMKLNLDSVLEAKELVKEGKSQFWVRSEGEHRNEMFLGYMETALVKFSCWK